MPEYGWVRIDGREVFRRLTPRIPPLRSDLPFPMVVSDQIETTSMVDGKVYTSKAALRAAYRAGGYIEVGNEEMKPAPKPKPDRKAVREAAGKALNRVGIST